MSRRFATGIDDLDPLLGGGFVRGGTVSVQYNDERTADLVGIRLGINIFDNLLSMSLLHRSGLSERRLGSVLDGMQVSMDSLLENDQLFVLDAHDEWSGRKGVFDVGDTDDIRAAVEAAYDRGRSRGTGNLVDIETLRDLAGRDAARDLVEWYETGLRGERDLLMNFVHRPPLPDEIVDHCTERADQVLTLDRDGEHVVLRVAKTPDGEVGATRRVERLDEAPYVRLVADEETS